MSLPVIFLMGPTATGKTDVAVELAREFPVDLISVDSAMVYRGMNIGTAKPPASILNEVPHRLVDICEPDETYSAANFRNDALREIEDIHNHDRIPLLVGGTGLYFRALEDGISALPDADETVRQRLEAEAKEIGWEAMHQKLAEIDPEAAERIHPNDPQRIQRALEVYEISGQSMTTLHQDETAEPLPFPVIKIILSPEDRAPLHHRIKVRLEKMFDDGFIEEVRKFHQNERYSKSLPAMRMVGYRQVWEYLDGELNEEELLEKAVVATRQLAKRQMTWFRKEKNGSWFDSEDPENLSKIRQKVAKEAQFTLEM